MSKLVWSNFLHIYQPPTQSKKMLSKVTEESYRKIIAGLMSSPQAKLTLNINGCLTELLAEAGFTDLLDDISKLIQRGQLELTDSAMYHAFLPNLPKSEVIRQIELNRAVNRRYFGADFTAKGFFMPEMAYTRQVAEIVNALGYQWIIIDEAGFPGEAPPADRCYRIKNLPMLVFFRERAMSFKILSAQLGTGSLLIRDLGERLNKSEYLLTAMDGETFGHHRLGLEQLLFDIYNAQELTTVTISELPKLFPKTEEVEPLTSSWALMHKDQARSEPLSRWHDAKNIIHNLQWQLTNLAITAVAESDQKSSAYAAARHSLDRSLHSDQYWWASAKPWWSLEMIERGAYELKHTVELTPGIDDEKKKQAEKLYYAIITQGFAWQREGVVEAMVKEHYDEEVSQRLDLSVPMASEAEFKKIISHLEKQMLAAAQEREYERAAQFKRRIAELEAERNTKAKQTAATIAHRHITNQPPANDTDQDWGV